MAYDRPTLTIAAGREKALLRHHPWIFSGAVRRMEGNPQEGDLVDVLLPDGRWVATGHFQNDSIVCKVLSFDTPNVDEGFFRQRLASAINYRWRMGLKSDGVFRMVHAEGALYHLIGASGIRIKP